MDFSEVELSDDDRAFQAELRGFLARVVTDDVIERTDCLGKLPVIPLKRGVAAVEFLVKWVDWLPDIRTGEKLHNCDDDDKRPNCPSHLRPQRHASYRDEERERRQIRHHITGGEVSADNKCERDIRDNEPCAKERRSLSFPGGENGNCHD